MPSFFVEGTPAPQGSKSGFIRGGRVVLVESSKKVKPWREAVGAKAREEAEKIEGAVELRVLFIMPRPKSMSISRPTPPCIKRTGDLDKLIRSTNDALTELAFNDDSNVVLIKAGKVTAESDEIPGAYIEVVPVQSGNDHRKLVEQSVNGETA